MHCILDNVHINIFLKDNFMLYIWQAINSTGPIFGTSSPLKLQSIYTHRLPCSALPSPSWIKKMTYMQPLTLKLIPNLGFITIQLDTCFVPLFECNAIINTPITIQQGPIFFLTSSITQDSPDNTRQLETRPQNSMNLPDH